MEWKIENGSGTRFWVDKWVGEDSFQNIFPRLFLNSEQKGEVISNMGFWVDNKWVWVWKLEWRREWFEWETILVDEHRSILESVSINLAREDH